VSVAVPLEKLRSAIAETDRQPYLLTTADDGRPHSVAVDFAWRDDTLVVPVGNRTLANARARPNISLLWPPKERGGYSLIVDGSVVGTTGSGNGDHAVRVRPTAAVLHRPATGATEPGCGADCIPLFRAEEPRPQGR
jgi:Pyridoxamine 5'-phosphate oxidase